MAIEEQYDSQHFLVESINILLETIGEPPISTLEDINNVLEAEQAQRAIYEAKKFILSKGWDVNTDTNYPFYPDTDGYINIPPHVLDINVEGDTIIMRDWKLYDKANLTRKFEEAIECTVKWNLDFNSIPHPLRYFITINAARKFQDRYISDSSMHSYTKEDEAQALIVAKKSNGFTSEYNILSSTYSSNFVVL